MLQAEYVSGEEQGESLHSLSLLNHAPNIAHLSTSFIFPAQFAFTITAQNIRIKENKGLQCVLQTHRGSINLLFQKAFIVQKHNTIWAHLGKWLRGLGNLAQGVFQLMLGMDLES